MRDFWLRTPMYIVICVLLGFVIAGLAAQNITLKAELTEIKQEQRDAQIKADDLKQQTDRIIAYLRCISLTPVGERTPELIDKCLSEDLPPQLSTGNDRRGDEEPSFLAPAPNTGTSQQPNQPVDNSPGNSGQTPSNPQNPNPEQPQQPGILDPITNPLRTNLTPRTCATLGL